MKALLKYAFAFAEAYIGALAIPLATGNWPTKSQFIAALGAAIVGLHLLSKSPPASDQGVTPNPKAP